MEVPTPRARVLEYLQTCLLGLVAWRAAFFVFLPAAAVFTVVGAFKGVRGVVDINLAAGSSSDTLLEVSPAGREEVINGVTVDVVTGLKTVDKAFVKDAAFGVCFLLRFPLVSSEVGTTNTTDILP